MTQDFKPAPVTPVMASPKAGASIVDAPNRWVGGGVDGFWLKPLYEDAAHRHRIWPLKADKGSFAEFHTADDIERIYVLEGGFVDEHETYRAGDTIIRRPGATHVAGSKDGAIVLMTCMARTSGGLA